jgi:hypothetical protein
MLGDATLQNGTVSAEGDLWFSSIKSSWAGQEERRPSRTRTAHEQVFSSLRPIFPINLYVAGRDGLKHQREGDCAFCTKFLLK